MKIFLTSIFLMMLVATQAQSVVLFEDFENGIPNNWTLIDGDGFTVHPSVVDFQPAWISLDDPFRPNNKIVGSTSYFEPEAKAFRLLVTPQISLGAFGNFVSWQSMSHDPSFPDWIMVLVSTTGNALEDFTDTLFRLNNEFPYWTDRTVSLSDSGYVNQDVYLAFVNHTNRGFKLYLDSIQVEVDNPVSAPSFIKQDLVMYPNPAQDEVYFQTQLAIDKIDVIDQSGRVVQSSGLANNRLDISQIEQGLYFVRIHTSNGIETRTLRKI